MAEDKGSYSKREVVFDKKISLDFIGVPEEARAGGTFPLFCGATLVKHPFKGLNMYHVFIHLYSPEGKLAFVTGTPVGRALQSREQGFSVERVSLPEDLPAGEYKVLLGVWNRQSQRKMIPSGPDVTRKERRSRRVSFGSIKVLSKDL
jgi:hypothetical protein